MLPGDPWHVAGGQGGRGHCSPGPSDASRWAASCGYLAQPGPQPQGAENGALSHLPPLSPQAPVDLETKEEKKKSCCQNKSVL